MQREDSTESRIAVSNEYNWIYQVQFAKVSYQLEAVSFDAANGCKFMLVA